MMTGYCTFVTLRASAAVFRFYPAFRHQASASLTRQVSSSTILARPTAPSADSLVREDLEGLYPDIRKALTGTQPGLGLISQYHFNGEGKAMTRPVVTMCLARAVNHHLNQNSLEVIAKQKKVAQIAEMIHTASLVHDDVIDSADSPSVNDLWGNKKSIVVGDYILAVASGMLAQLNNPHVIFLLSQGLADLVQGEFMQLGARENEEERFTHYMDKTFKKTASLIAYSCQAVAALSGADSELQSVSFQFGRQLGMAFQLVDDLFDFKLVLDSNGPERTKELAATYCTDAIAQLVKLDPSPYQRALVSMTDKMLHRIN